MRPQPRDWDKELAEIDRLIAATPPERARSGGDQPGVPTGAARPAPPARVARGSALGTWVRVGLGVGLAAAMTQWPYARACGLALFLYLGAVGVVLIAGGWAAVTSWRQRMGLAHVLSLLVMLWALILAAAVVLPRVGYAREAAAWWC